MLYTRYKRSQFLVTSESESSGEFSLDISMFFRVLSLLSLWLQQLRFKGMV